MAKINGIYVFVEKEDLSFGVDVTEHVVEDDLAISDHVKRKAIVLSLTGEIVGENAKSVLSKLKNIHQSGTIVKYSGTVSLSNALITEFATSQSSDVWGGYRFTMSIKQIRTASTSYTPTAKNADQPQTTKKTGTQQVTTQSKDEYVYHTTKKGDTVWDLVIAKDAPYKKYGFNCKEVLELNPDAFSIKGDYRTLQIGKKIIVGKR